MVRCRWVVWALAGGLTLAWASHVPGQPARAPAPAAAPAAAASGPASAPATRPAFPLWDGKEAPATYAKRAGIKQTEIVLEPGKGTTLRAALVPAGKFLMGASQPELDEIKKTKHKGDPTANALPQHEITITRPFYMGVFTVTQDQYAAVMGANPSTTKAPRNPVETVTWDNAAEFCRKLSDKTGKTVRLPTEAEWEYACRAGTATPFHTGETINVDQANYDGSAAPWGKGVKGLYRNKILPVGSFKPNAWGLYDMHGNVAQWVADWYGQDYYAQSPAADPKGPETGTRRVQRGSGYGYAPEICRSSCRSSDEPVRPPAWLAWTGFRVVVELP